MAVESKYVGEKNGLYTPAVNVNNVDSSTLDVFISNPDKYLIQENGDVAFVDEDGSTQLIPHESKTVPVGVDQQAVKELADLVYLSQNTGVATSDLQAAYEKLGIAGSTSVNGINNEASVARNLLEQYGYTPGDNKNFYGNNTPDDIGASALSEQWQLAPEDGTAVNDASMNAVWLSQKLGDQASQSKARLRDSGLTEENQRFKRQSTYNKYSPGRSTDDERDIFQWGLASKTSDVADPGYDPSGLSGVVDLGGTGGVGTGTGTSTGSGDTSIGTGFTSTPNIGTPSVVYPEGLTGLSEVEIPTYEAGLGLQQQQFEDRAVESAKLRQPQTLAEQQAAGTAPAFENVLYRNRFGMSMYVQHINGVPSQPIPPGYYRVQGFGTEAQTQGGSTAANTTQAQNKGGVIQGFNEAGLTVNPALNYQPGGTVVEENGVFRIKYPDGTYSQNYDTAMNAKAANDMGLANLGLPDYATYLSDQGVNMNLPGYDETAYQSAYQSYISDPATLQNIQTQQQQQQTAVDTTPQTGTVNQELTTGQTEVTRDDLAQYQANLNAQAYANPGGAVAASPVDYIDPNTYGTVIESTAGQALETAPMVQEDQVAQIGEVTTADVPTGQGAATYDANLGYENVSLATQGMEAETLTGPTQTITAEEQKTSSVSGLDAATGESVDVTDAPTRELETRGGQSELITGTGVDQSKVIEAFGEGELQAASVQDELTGLMQQFQGGETPAWAAGSMRAAMATLAARGLGASSMAGQAVIQAAMESALPIAQIDASNKQQVALFKAEQRAKFLQMDFDQAFQAKVMNAAKISEIANMNFTAEQQIALENAKAANTMELQNLSNEQALIMAEAAALSQLDTQNLSNRQQAAVQNAQNFLQVDMANLANEQQTSLFKQQSLINSILSDQAASNAAAQFNATSENQTDQFFSNLAASVNQFNAAQMNAMKQFNADEVNSLLEFNASMQNQREMFNAQNYLVVAQANAQWRQNLATINTAAANESNMAYTQAVNGLTMTSLDEIWQRERDILSMAFQISENNANRANEIVLQKLAADASTDAAKLQADIEASAGAGDFVKEVFLKIIGI